MLQNRTDHVLATNVSSLLLVTHRLVRFRITLVVRFVSIGQGVQSSFAYQAAKRNYAAFAIASIFKLPLSS